MQRKQKNQPHSEAGVNRRQWLVLLQTQGQSEALRRTHGKLGPSAAVAGVSHPSGHHSLVEQGPVMVIGESLLGAPQTHLKASPGQACHPPQV